MTGLRQCTRLAEIPAADWDALAGGQPFLRHAFLSSLEDSGCLRPESGWLPAHQLLEDADGRLIAALPAYLKGHSWGEYVFDMAWADACARAGIAYYPKLLGAVPFTPVQGPRLLGEAPARRQLLEALPGQLRRQGLSGAHVNFTEADDDALFAGQDGWLSRLGCQFHWFDRGYGHFAGFLEALSSRKRKQLRKERQRLQGIELQWLDGDELDEADWAFVHACYARTYEVRGREPYLNLEFFLLLAERMPEALQVVMASRAGRRIAMAFYLRDGQTLYGRYWGALEDIEGLHFECCFYQGIERALALGLRRFDAGAQGEHKLLRGFEPVLTRSWHWLEHPGLRVAVADSLMQEAQAVRAYAEEARAWLPYRCSDGD